MFQGSRNSRESTPQSSGERTFHRNSREFTQARARARFGSLSARIQAPSVISLLVPKTILRRALETLDPRPRPNILPDGRAGSCETQHHTLAGACKTILRKVFGTLESNPDPTQHHPLAGACKTILRRVFGTLESNPDPTQHHTLARVLL